jgi:diadenosine tetraphosphate (Ap4A) HIT family hydrolase
VSDFSLDARLEADCARLAESEQSLLLLRNDARFPWLILVPKQSVTELHELPAQAQNLALSESLALASALRKMAGVEKINLAAIGNIVRQLHIHVIGRRVGDAAWPGVVWGHPGAISYEGSQIQEFQRRLRAALAGDGAHFGRGWTWSD